LVDKVPFHRPYMARRCIKVGGDGTISTLARRHKRLVFCVDFRKVGKFTAFIERPKAN